MRRTLLLALAAVGTLGCPEQGGEHQARLAGVAAGWNVLLLSVDTLRADRLGAYGYTERETSPNIDRLLGRGTRFAQAMAPRALTWPSLASVLTGLYPSGHGLVSNGYRFSEEQVTLPKLLQASGYQTAAFLSNMCQANHQGWDAFVCGGGVDTKVIERSRAWAEAIDRARPFLIWVHLFGPHPPYYNGGELAAQVLDPGYSGPLAPKKRALDRVMTEELALTDADRRHLDALYDAAVIGTDALVGQLLDALGTAGLLERTVVVFLADHGEELYQHNRYLYHACSVYQTTLHVPLGLVAVPIVPSGAQVEPTVELIDVLPTLLELLGVSPPAALHGVSLAPYLEPRSRRGDGKPAFSEYERFEVDGREARIRTVLDGDWKLIDNPGALTPVCMPGAPADFYRIQEVELYNLAQDPHETRNLAPVEPGRVAALRRLIRDRFAGLPAANLEQTLPAQLKQELEDLGYIAN